MSIADVERVFTAWLLAAARAVPVTWSIPAFGGNSLPTAIRLSIGLGLSFLCLPRAGVQAVDGAVFLVLCVREALVGVTLAFVCACAFRAAESAGRLLDVSRGAGSASFPLPLS